MSYTSQLTILLYNKTVAGLLVAVYKEPLSPTPTGWSLVEISI